METDLDTILSQTPQGSTSVDKTSATDSSTTTGRNYHEIDRSEQTETSHAQGMTPMERFQAEGFGDGPWHNVKDVYMPKK
ncbi:hypothetical protein N0V85_001535 [Neurospora sp. IMI 360204]|nr:hypothetical protein N0V85_001535 [Neurospora sp. IMI 360204]